MTRICCALLLLASTASAQPRTIGEIHLPADGAAHFGHEPGAVTTPGVFRTEATTGDRSLASSGGVSVSIRGGEVYARLTTSAGQLTLTAPALDDVARISFDWTEDTARLIVDGLKLEAACGGDPVPNLGPLTVGKGGGDPLVLRGWLFGPAAVFADGFESGDASAW